MNDPKNQDRQSKQQQDATGANLKHIKVSIDALANQIDTQRREQKEGKEQEQKWPRRTAKAAAIYTFLTLIIMGVTAYQAYLIRSNNVIGQRAFVSIAFTGGNVAYVPTPKQFTVASVLDATQGAGDVAGVNFIANLTNSGNTPTKNLTFFFKCATSSEMLQEPWSILYQGMTNPGKAPQFIGSHATVQATCSIPGDQIRAMAKGTLFGYLMVDVAYQDRLSEDWHKTQSTTFIGQVQFAPTIEPTGTRGTGVNFFLATYGAHNCADEECPK